MTLKTQTSRRGIIVTSAAAAAAVLVAVGATAMMQDDDKSGATVEQSAPQNQGEKPAEATPTFLATAELPATPEAKTWTEQPGTTPGLPDPEYTCIKGKLPVASTTYKSWSGDMTAEMRQFVTVFADAAAAEAAVKGIEDSISACASAIDDGKTTVEKFGQYPDVADGVSVHGAFFAPVNSEFHLQLFGVGRDGKTVVVTTLGQMGQEEDAPVEAFTTTAKTAVEKVF